MTLISAYNYRVIHPGGKVRGGNVWGKCPDTILWYSTRLWCILWYAIRL